jgi:hypothetical protein
MPTDFRPDNLKPETWLGARRAPGGREVYQFFRPEPNPKGYPAALMSNTWRQRNDYGPGHKACLLQRPQITDGRGRHAAALYLNALRFQVPRLLLKIAG